MSSYDSYESTCGSRLAAADAGGDDALAAGVGAGDVGGRDADCDGVDGRVRSVAGGVRGSTVFRTPVKYDTAGSAKPHDWVTTF